MKKIIIMLWVAMVFLGVASPNYAEAVTNTTIYLQQDSYWPCFANGSVKFKGGTNLLVDSSNNNNVISGTLAQDTSLYYTLNYSPNSQVPQMSAKFKGGTNVKFICWVGNVVGLVTRGTLAEDSKFHNFYSDGCNNNFVLSSLITYKAGGVMDLTLTYVSGYPSSGILAIDTYISVWIGYT